MSIHKAKNGTWYVKYHNKTKRGFTTKKDAQQYEAKMKLSIINTSDCNNVFFSDVANDYLDNLLQRYHSKSISYGTYAKGRHAVQEMIIPNIANKKIASISELDCRKFYEIIGSTNYSTIYKNHILNVYKAIFKHAVTYFGLNHNPSHVIVPLKKTFDEKIKHKAKESNIWTPEEFEKFIACVHENIYKQLFTTLYFTGLRIGEALALKWSDYDGKFLHITKSYTRKTDKGKFEIKDTKNISSVRNIDLGINMSEYLNGFMVSEMSIPGFSRDWYIFGRTEPLAQTSIDRIKDKAIKQAQVKRIRIHDFRHSHASNLIANDINIVAVSKRLGHSNIDMTLNVYTHLLDKNEIELTEFVDKSSQNLLTTKKKPFD
ncbi:site-specific integrase [[Clostridium] innocuum]|nr:site-specific integrase [[Clostridium] innocuum]